MVTQAPAAIFYPLEIGSESAADVDLGSKRALYAEFYCDPLVGERLADGEYRLIPLNHESDGRVWGHSEALNLDLWWEDGELRFWDLVAGRWLLNLEEEHDSRVAAESRIAELEAEIRRLRCEG